MRSHAVIFWIAVLTLALVPIAVHAATPNEELFVRRVAPLLREKCIACHGGDPNEIEGGLDLRTLETAQAGGDSEESAIVLGKPELSPVLLAAKRESDDWSPMPPKEAEKLTEEQLNWLHDWIAAGADWPTEKRQAQIQSTNADAWSAEDGIPVATSGGLDKEWTNRRYKPEALWAYQKVQKPGVPDEATAIDWLLSKNMPIDVARRADRVTLIRRATFDLIGLPPTLKEVAAFQNDERRDEEAFAALVERLLASKHYGERMAQHWLDVTRYADSSGLANDFERGNAWRYRDYVVRAFNEDKPYDEFIREQIAGDEIDSNDPEHIIATGFLRMGPWELTGMEVAKVARQRFLDDVTNSVGEVFLAHSLQCARCHDHKFDPVPTRDYYSVQAVFATTQLVERKAAFLPGENTAGFEERSALTRARDAYRAKLKELDGIMQHNAKKWFSDKNLPSDNWDAAIAKAKEGNADHVFNAARTAMRKQGFEEEAYPPKLVGFLPEQFGMERVARKGIQRLSWQLDRYKPFALSVYNGSTPNKSSISSPTRIPENTSAGEREQTCILAGGDPFSPTEAVQPSGLSVLELCGLETPSIEDEIDGKRLALAKWVSDPQNSLTTRAIVNRIWMWHFNQPIAGNPNNFGGTGKPPTHPQLLDWLAATLVEDGWSWKSLHRRIMNSDAYCRSSEHHDPKSLREKDPLDQSYARFRSRRLSAEEMRDAQLSVTDELNPTIGGIPCRPEINIEVALQPRQVMGTFAAAWVPSAKPSQRHRRSIYTLKLRGLADPLFEVFNSPARDFSCEQRDASIVTPQVFSLFNGKATHSRALALANRVVSETDSDEAAVRKIFLLAYSRPPSPDELRTCLEHWRTIERDLANADPPKQFTPPREVVRDAIEENTGEQFSFAERLFGYDDFEPDLQPADVGVHVRALSDICLVIFNSNEFVYVY